MRRAQTNRYSMYQRVADVLEKNKSIWENKKAMVDSISNFINNMKEIEEVDARLLQSTKGATKDKNQLKTDLLQMAFIFAAEASAMAAKMGDYQLMEKCRIKKSLALSYSDTEAKDFATMILANVESRLTQLADYNITETEVTKYKGMLDQFAKSISNKNVVKSDYSTDISYMADLFSNNASILSNEINYMMRSYKKSHPLFYDAWRKARKINDLGGSSKKPSGNEEANTNTNPPKAS
jgi:hypothetical protein